MDIRGVEITNQLRSAIRAKLLELGVRYDEELPDYILVMVVNKKSRQQMNEDLNLFLEDSTEPFVNWLHDQVLKKLQKVTIAKKKSNKDGGPAAIVKKEEDQKRVKVEDRSNTPDKKQITTKKERDREFEELVGDLTLLNEEGSRDTTEAGTDENKLKKNRVNLSSFEFEINESFNSETQHDPSIGISSISELEAVIPAKRISDVCNSSRDRDIHGTKRRRISTDSEEDRNKLNKPKITSVISVKTRLGVTSPSKKSESYNKTISRHGSSLNKSIDRKKQQSEELRVIQKKTERGDLREKVRLNKANPIKSRLGSATHKQEKLSSTNSSNISKPKVSNIKSRLGIRSENRDTQDIRTRLLQIAQGSKHFQEDDTESVINTSLKSQVIAVQIPTSTKSKNLKISKQLSGTVNQDIKHYSEAAEDKNDNEEEEEEEEDKEDQCKISSKIIVTPRPLKPLQPFQRRATQSLLLKAVAEANQSVVMQKKVDPCLKEQKPVKKIKITRDLRKGKIISVQLNNTKTEVLDKIHVELTNQDSHSSKQSHSSKTMKADESLDVVKSLFKRSDDKQKFLVTLNGYNNNVFREKNSDDEERLEMEVNEDDEFNFPTNQYESYNENDETINNFDFNQDNCASEEYQETDYIDEAPEENDNSNSENYKFQDYSEKKRSKLSPIVYTRSHSNSPLNKSMMVTPIISISNKKPLLSSVITTLPDKSSERCRYWPNCTLGVKCTYYHPDVPCSAFPACKFGDKCAYKHPKCKFGSACTKMGCIFAHPPVQCKYHPYCMKPGCPFSHTKTTTPLSPLDPLPDISSVKAKFTWKRKD